MIITGSFSATSRYAKLPVLTYVDADGHAHSYVARRFVPPSSSFTLLQHHTIVEGDRLDNLGARYLGDPEMFWKLCDANDVLDPDELTARVGRQLRITLPEGVPAPVPHGR